MSRDGAAPAARPTRLVAVLPAGWLAAGWLAVATGSSVALAVTTAVRLGGTLATGAVRAVGGGSVPYVTL